MKKTALTVLALSASLLLSVPSHAQSNASEGSALSALYLSFAAGSVVSGSAQALGGLSSATVASVAVVGQSTVLVLKDASGVVVGSIKVASSAVGAASIAVGSALKFVTESVGYAVYSGSQIIAFIPNELGNSLIYNTKVK